MKETWLAHQRVYCRYPDLTDNFFVFVSDDDLWRVNLHERTARGEGEDEAPLRAFRLTTNSAFISNPKISPDGQHIAYECTESGDKEIYVMPSDGGLTKRVTYKGRSLLYGWTAAGHLRVASQYGRYGSLGLYTITTTGQELACDEYGMVSAYAKTSYGEVVARNPGDIARWKGYRGGLIGEIWTKPVGHSSFSKIMPDSRSNLCNVVCQDDRIYFISDRGGRGDIYVTDFSGSAVVQLTTTPSMYIRAFALHRQRLLYACGGELYLQSIPADLGLASQPQHTAAAVVPWALNIRVSSSFDQVRSRFIDPQKYLQSFAPSYTGAHIMVVVRGALYAMEPWTSSARRVALPAGLVRARKVFGFGQKSTSRSGSSRSSAQSGSASAQHDSGKDFLAVAVNEQGEDRLIHLLWNAKQRQYTSTILHENSIGKIWTLKAAQNQDFVILATLRYELWHFDLNAKKLHLIARHNEPVDHIDIANEWVSYSAHHKLLQEVYLYHIPSRQRQLLFKGTESEHAPTFDRTDHLLYLFSHRDLQITEGSYTHIMTPLSGAMPYVLTLDKTTTSLLQRPKLFVEKSTSPPSQAAAPAASSAPGPAGTTAASGDQAAAPWFDLRDIESRLEALPLRRARWHSIYAADDKIFFLEDIDLTAEHGEDTGAQNYRLHSYTKSTGEVQALDQVNQLILTGDGQYFLCLVGRELLLTPVDEKITLAEGESMSKSRSKRIDLSRIRHQINPKQEWDQMLVEALYLQQENLHNEAAKPDYAGILACYRPLVELVHTRSEFSDLIQDMQGELKTSHCYEYRGDYVKKPTYQPCGYLGGTLRYRKSKRAFVIEALQRGERWNAATRSPLLGPGVALSEGDEILQIDGQALRSTHELDQYLNNRASTAVELTIRRTSQGSFHPSYLTSSLSAHKSASTHRCTITTLPQHSELSYHDWVRRNREFVTERSQGTVGYLHIPDMSEFGLTEFYKQYLKELDHPKLIVDVRYNRGGFVSEIIINHLASKAIASQRGKWVAQPLNYPTYSAPQHMVCLINGYAGSDGDIFSQAFKDLSLGTLVGTRTWGGVIGIWPRLALIDGTYTSQPEFSFVFHNNQRVLENEGALPHVTVDITPDQWQQHLDAQLEEAIKQFELPSSS